MRRVLCPALVLLCLNACGSSGGSSSTDGASSTTDGATASDGGSGDRAPSSDGAGTDTAVGDAAADRATSDGGAITDGAALTDGAQADAVATSDGSAPDGAPATDAAPGTGWSSWLVVTQAGTPQATVAEASGGPTASLELYESTNDFGVDKNTLLPLYTAGAHSDPTNAVEKYWAPSVGGYPYVGKSTLGRGSEAGETNAQAPLGVRDLQLHPTFNNHLIVVAFIAPAAGTYDITDLAAREVQNCGTGAKLMVFGPAKTVLREIMVTNNRAWVTGAPVSVGTLAMGDRIYFGVDPRGSYACDPTEISWTIHRAP